MPGIRVLRFRDPVKADALGHQSVNGKISFATICGAGEPACSVTYGDCPGCPVVASGQYDHGSVNAVEFGTVPLICHSRLEQRVFSGCAPIAFRLQLVGNSSCSGAFEGGPLRHSWNIRKMSCVT